MFKRILRYGSMDLEYFSNSIYFFEKTLTKKLLPEGSFFKILFQFDNEWFTLAKDKNSKLFYLSPIENSNILSLLNKALINSGELYIK
jgi:hypothetical protein